MTLKLLYFYLSPPIFQRFVALCQEKWTKGHKLGFGLAVLAMKYFNFVVSFDFEDNKTEGAVVTEQDLILLKDGSEIFPLYVHKNTLNIANEISKS